MQELFDNNISEKIKTTFENYEVPFEEAAWLKMKEKLKPQKNRKVIFWANFAKAAIILLLLSLSIFVTLKITDYKETDSKKFSKNDNFINNNRDLKTYSEYENNENNSYIADYKEETNNNVKNNNQKKSNTLFNESTQKLIENKQITNQQTENIIEENIIVFYNNSVDCVQVVIENKKIDSLKSNNQQIVIDESIFNQDKKKKEKRIKFGIELSSNCNYTANNVSSNVNFGGGITSDIRILKNLSINTGIIFGNQNLDYGSKLVFGDQMNYESTNSMVDEETYQNVKLLALDVPINLQYDVKNFFVSAGISSYTYVNEKYEGTYFSRETVSMENADGSFNSVEAMVEQENIIEYKAFNRLDLAKLFNVSFGYKVPLKKGELVFEPYFKYPIGELSTGEIAFGLGGMSVKYKF